MNEEKRKGFVYLIDDDTQLTDRLVERCREAGWRAYGFGSAEAFLRATPVERPACVVLGLRLPDQDGAAVMAELLDRGFDSRPVVIAEYADVPTAVACMHAGAYTVLEKPLDDDRLLETVAEVIREDAVRCKSSERLRELRHSSDKLTDRQQAVLSRLLCGSLNKQIAIDLKVSQRTVEVERAEIMKKFRCRNVAELATKATELRLLSGASIRIDHTPGDGPLSPERNPEALAPL